MKILPLSEESPIKNYGIFAFPIGCLLSEKNFSSNYIFNNFLHISPEYKNFNTVKWSFLKKWKCFYVKRFIAFSYDTFISKIEYMLDNNWYVFLNINEKYIPYRYSYKKRNFLHDNYICGYNQKNKKFLVYGYDENMQFVNNFIDYKIIYQAYRNSFSKFLFWNMFFKVKTNFDYNYVSAFKIVSDLIRNYKSSNKYYGINLYNHIIDQLKVYNYMNLRYYRYLIEYRLLLVCNKKYFNDMHAFNKLNEEILSIAKLTFALAIKYKVTNNTDLNLKKKILENIEKMKKKDIEIYRTHFDDNFIAIYSKILPLINANISK